MLPFAVFFVLCLGILIHAAATRRVLSAGGWAHRHKEPFLFWLGIVGAMAGLGASAVALTRF